MLYWINKTKNFYVYRGDFKTVHCHIYYTRILSIEIQISRARRNYYFYFSCTLTVKKYYWLNRNGSKRVFRLRGFPEFEINHDLKCEIQYVTSEILGHPSKMAKKSSHPTFPIDCFVREAYRGVKVLHNSL